jgi:hypothetical protein
MPRRDKLIREREHDPYQTRKKLPDPSACTECHVMYRDGRWQWGEPPADAKPVLCPACQRSRDGLPAGILQLEGEFHLAHRAEVLGLLRNIEEREVKAHALKRIMSVEEEGQTLTVTTAHPGLARSLGDALHHAYRGELDYHYPEESGVLRVRWSR